MVRYPDIFKITLKKNGGHLGFIFECPQNSNGREVQISEVTSQGALSNYNAHQMYLGKWHFVVLPEMRIDSVNDVAGDAHGITEELKRSDTVTLRIRRCEQVIISHQQKTFLNALRDSSAAPSQSPP